MTISPKIDIPEIMLVTSVWNSKGGWVLGCGGRLFLQNPSGLLHKLVNNLIICLYTDTLDQQDGYPMSEVCDDVH